MKSRTLYFCAPRQIEIREQTLPVLAPDQVLVETVCSSISSGSEMLVYRGQFPKNLPDSHDAFSSGLHYPLAYGYANIGRVMEIGKGVELEWMDRMVFAFQPHTSHYITTPDSLLAIPAGLSYEAACLLPSMETAVNLVQDAAPILGERVLVFGQGIVGLMTSALLSEFPLDKLITSDCYPLRRQASLDNSGAISASLDPLAADFHSQVNALLKSGADLTLELSGNPSALNDALALTTFSGRIVIGSWYGEKRQPIEFGGAFHRSRIKLISSQVSTISPELSGRWDKTRRFQQAWAALERIKPEKWITHRFTLGNAELAYHLLDENPQEAIQVLLTSKGDLE